MQAGVESWSSENESSEGSRIAALGLTYLLEPRELSAYDFDALDCRERWSTVRSVAVRAGPPRKLVVKVCPPDEGTGKLREPGRHLEALRFSPTFAKRHLVGLVYESLRVGGGEWVLFQEFAGGGAPDTFPLSKLLDSVWSRRGRPGSLCTADEFASVCKTVVSAMLREWVAAKGNPEDNRVVDVGTFLGWHLDGRHEPGGSLHRWAMSCAPDLLDPSNGRSAFVQGHENPLSLVTNPSLSWNLKVWPLLGPRYGDLHPANILVPVGNLHLAVKRRRRSPAFRLIDLSRFEEQAPLTGDPVHLLLSIVARGLGRMSLEEQDALIPFLVDPGDNSGDLVATWLKKVVIAITSVVPDWVKASFMREWREQTQLSLLACALIFTGRRTTLDAHREWFLRLAAAAGDAFRRSADGPIIELQEAGGTQGRLVQTVQSPLLHAIDQPESGSPTELPTRELGPPAPAAERVDAAQLRDEGGGTGKRRRPTVAPELMRAADALAEVVQEQWEKAAEGRRLEYPGSIRVYWKKALAPVVGPVADALRSGAGVRRTGPLPGAAAQTVETLSGGEISSLLLVYCGLPSGRLVILGAPGAGKTATAIRLVLDVLSYRANFPGPRERAAVAVPVILTPHDWDPERQSVNVWLSQRVAADYPLLRSREYSSDTAAQLVDKGLVALVLDGLDDLSERARSVALRELDRQTRCRLVVLSRSAEMATAAAQAHMSAAVAVELRPVEPVEAADYLARCKVDPLPPDWQQLVDHLRRNPTCPVAQALDSPLMLGLVRDTYR